MIHGDRRTRSFIVSNTRQLSRKPDHGAEASPVSIASLPRVGSIPGVRGELTHTGLVMGDPGPCPACETADLERRGGKDFCPRCYYIQPCCDGGICT